MPGPEQFQGVLAVDTLPRRPEVVADEVQFEMFREEKGVERHQDRPLPAVFLPLGYRSSTDRTVVSGHAFAIPASPLTGWSTRK